MSLRCVPRRGRPNEWRVAGSSTVGYIYPARSGEYVFRAVDGYQFTSVSLEAIASYAHQANKWIAQPQERGGRNA